MREKDERTRRPVCGVGVFTEVEYEDPTPEPATERTAEPEEER